MKQSKFSVLVVFCLSGALTTLAQQNGGATAAAPRTTNAQTAQTTTVPASGFRAEFLRQHEDVAKKYVELAQATPQDKFGWRPAEGVRSISEVYMHIAGSNFMILQAVGVKPPAGIDLRGLEKITDKAKVVETLRLSMEQVRQAAANISESDMNKPAKVFGRDTTVRDVFLLLATHIHEHLGQSIAYARMNNIVPPWTAARQSRQG